MTKTHFIGNRKHWLVDGAIDLTSAAEGAQWHRQTTVETLLSQGLNSEDAQAFTEFIFEEEAGATGGGTTYDSPEEALTADQWDRLEYAR